MVDQPVAIVQRLREMLSRVDEQHGGGTIDGGDEVQQHGGTGDDPCLHDVDPEAFEKHFTELPGSLHV